ncbi:MAG: YihY/virulence factor BrkB family protein [Candidatus Nanopelagicales bacterium]|nr:YihY/virulence factor BrkB family protein [Candidatus Nanopelagicales bacterium]
MSLKISAVMKPAKAIFGDYGTHQGSLASGGMAYFVLLAIAPAAVVIGSVTGAVIGPERTKAAIEAIVEKIPSNGSDFHTSVESILNVMTGASVGALTITSIASFFVAIYASSKAIMALRMALDRSFGFTSERHGLFGRVRDAVITLIGLLLIVAILVVLTLLPRVLSAFGIDGFQFSTGIAIIDWLIYLAIVWCAVIGLYKWAPSKKGLVNWRSPIAILVAVWLLGASIGVGIYVGFSSTIGVTIAAFGAPMVILLWLYFSFIGVLLGAEAQMYLNKQGERVHV